MIGLGGIRRFLLHVLPEFLRRISYYGFLGPIVGGKPQLGEVYLSREICHL
jgi:hypothetical protein